MTIFQDLPGTIRRFGGADDTENMVRAAWYYFVGGLNQSEVAERLGLSRIKVNRLVAQARAEGHVHIRVTHPSARALAVEHEVAMAYGLATCRIVPSTGNRSAEDALADRRAVAIAAADFLANEVGNAPDGIFGIGWGNTLAETVAQFDGVSAAAARFVALMGSLTRKAAANPFESVHRLAEKTGGVGYFIPAPYMADSVTDRQVLLAQRTVQGTLDLAAQADLCLVGVTEASPTSFLLEQQLVTQDEHDDAQRAGAVGSFTGLFLDARGRIVSCDLNERRVGLEPQVMRTRRVVAVASGIEKAKIVRAGILGGFFRGLVADEALGRMLIDEARA